MDIYLGFRCSLCKIEYNFEEIQYTCPKDGGNLDVVYDFHRLKIKVQPQEILSSIEHSLWRYLPLLPVKDPGFLETPLRSAGYTPVYSFKTMAKQIGIDNLWIKDDSRNPTASFKDRASAIVVAKARERHSEIIVTASTGNAGAALAGMSAAVGQKAIIFAPKTAPTAKVAQLLVYGAKVFLVDGTYDDAFELSINAANEFGWYCRNTGYNPFTLEGKKTAAFEIWEFFKNFKTDSGIKSPLKIFVSVGDGNIISGLHKGFKDLYELGWLEELPSLYGVQAEGSASISNAWFSRTEIIQPVSAKTIADSISVDLPRDGVRAIRAMRETGGRPVLVSDDEIIRAISELGKYGIFTEPAGAASYAGIIKAITHGWITKDDNVMIVVTGSGLKDVRAAMQSVSEAPIIEPTLAAVKKMMVK